jgi:hypothetical protein
MQLLLEICYNMAKNLGHLPHKERGVGGGGLPIVDLNFARATLLDTSFAVRGPAKQLLDLSLSQEN